MRKNIATSVKKINVPNTGTSRKSNVAESMKFKLKQQKIVRKTKRMVTRLKWVKRAHLLNLKAVLPENRSYYAQTKYLGMLEEHRLQFKRYHPEFMAQQVKKVVAKARRTSAKKKDGLIVNPKYMLGKLEHRPWQKGRINTYDKLFYYYTARTTLSLYSHKAFLIIEMQVNSALVRIKLVPFLFMVNALCFYRVVEVNGVVRSSPYYVLSRYDSINIPLELHHYAYYRSYRTQYYPWQLANFFKYYWMQFNNFSQNKIGLLSSFLVSNITAEGIVFDYPNVISYIAPFSRFTNLYFRNQVYTDAEAEDDDEGPGTLSGLAYSHTLIKLKLFTYANFYKPK